ncbi:MAG: hypothetical protein QF531_03590 [Candidatus Poseidonia sp.]|nr:hypothetical protein [Poseidonia sp.]
MSAEVFMGYLVDHADDFTVVQSPFVMDGVRVFGADSDATTLAVAGVLHRLQHEAVDQIGIPDGIDATTVTLATSAHHHDEEETEPLWDLLLSDEATVVLARQGATVELPVLDVEVEVDPEFHDAIQAAWGQELNETHVSQGAYVSRSQYEEAAQSRLSLQGQQNEGSIVWPPRFSGAVHGQTNSTHVLKPTGTVQSWTTLSAAGAPSEFSLRAPLLGGISTVFLQLNDGPYGVFLTVDDEDTPLSMDLPMELVLRRIYAQEGFIRYGLKARAIQD